METAGVSDEAWNQISDSSDWDGDDNETNVNRRDQVADSVANNSHGLVLSQNGVSDENTSTQDDDCRQSRDECIEATVASSSASQELTSSADSQERKSDHGEAVSTRDVDCLPQECALFDRLALSPPPIVMEDEEDSDDEVEWLWDEGPPFPAPTPINADVKVKNEPGEVVDDSEMMDPEVSGVNVDSNGNINSNTATEASSNDDDEVVWEMDPQWERFEAQRTVKREPQIHVVENISQNVPHPTVPESTPAANAPRRGNGKNKKTRRRPSRFAVPGVEAHAAGMRIDACGSFKPKKVRTEGGAAPDQPVRQQKSSTSSSEHSEHFSRDFSVALKELHAMATSRAENTNELRPDIGKLCTEARPQLRLKYKSVFWTNEERSPLGCAYDHVLGVYAVACTWTKQIRFIRERGKEMNDRISGLHYPSSIISLKAGRTFAYVDGNRIFLVDLLRGSVRCIASTYAGHFRSICALGEETILTCLYRNKMGKSRIRLQVYRAGDFVHNRILCELDYWNDYGIAKDPMPCFSASGVDGYCTITDLGLNILIHLSWQEKEKILSRLAGVQLQNGQAMLAGQKRVWKRVSGVGIDKNGVHLVADALGAKLFMMQPTGRILQEVVVTDGPSFPYAAQIALGRRSLLTANRRTGGFTLFELSGGPAPGALIKKEEMDVDDEVLCLD